MFKFSCLMFLLACNCTPARFSYPMPSTKEDCMQLFTDVLNIQKRRNEASDQMSVYTNQINAGKMSVRKYRKKHHEWVAIENRLRGHVTHIYDVGYDAGCFDEEKAWE